MYMYVLIIVQYIRGSVYTFYFIYRHCVYYIL